MFFEDAYIPGFPIISRSSLDLESSLGKNELSQND